MNSRIIKIIKYLASRSYKKNDLDLKKVEAITKKLNRTDLKKYISALKKIEKERNLIVISPFASKDEKEFSPYFPNKKIIFKKDPSLISGIKIIDKDNVYELNLKNTLNNIANHTSQNYA